MAERLLRKALLAVSIVGVLAHLAAGLLYAMIVVGMLFGQF